MSHRLRKVLVGLLVLVGLVLVLPQGGTFSLSAAPLPPHVLYGQARTSDGTVLGANHLVQARVNNVHYAQSVQSNNQGSSQNTRTHAQTAVGQLNYGASANFQVCADDPATSGQEGASGGDRIYFYVAGIAAQVQRLGVDPSPVGYMVFEVGGAGQRVDLIISSLSEDKAIQATASSDACTTRKAETAKAVTVPSGGAPMGGGGGGAVATATTDDSASVSGPAAAPAPTADEVEGASLEEAVQIIESVTAELAAELVAGLTDEKAAAIMSQIDAETAASIIALVEAEKAADIIGLMEANQAAAIFDFLEAEHAAFIIELLENSTAAAIIELVDASKAASIIELLEIGTAAAIVGLVEIGRAAEIFDLLGASKGAAIVQELDSTKAAAIFELVDTVKAASIMELVNSHKAAEILNFVETVKAAAILSEVSPKKAGAIMEAIPASKLTSIVQEMKEQKLVDRLPEMSAGKLSDIPTQILFDKLPSVNSDQLANEIVPVADPALAHPVGTQVSQTISRYDIAETGEMVWTALVASPAPLDNVLGKFTRKATNVHVEVESLSVTPNGAPELPISGIRNSLFSIDIAGATSEELSAAHVTLFVNKSWVEFNQIHKWSIQFNRLDEELNMWVPFPSKRVSETADKIYYTVVVPGFSVFAITGSKELPDRMFHLGALAIEPAKPVLGESVAVSAKVTNLGSSLAVYPARLWLDDQIEATRALPVPAGDTVQVVFTIAKPEGRYNVRIDRLTDVLVVGMPPTPTPTATAISVSTPVPAAIPVRIPAPPVQIRLPTATSVPMPTAVSTALPVVQAAPPPPPSATPVPESTATPVATKVATAVTVVPTAVPTIAVIPTVVAIVQPTETPRPVEVETPDPTATPVLVEEEPADGTGGLMFIIIAGVLVILVGGAVAVYLRRQKGLTPPSAPSVPSST